jgi:hypothetical protein
LFQNFFEAHWDSGQQLLPLNVQSLHGPEAHLPSCVGLNVLALDLLINVCEGRMIFGGKENDEYYAIRGFNVLGGGDESSSLSES